MKRLLCIWLPGWPIQRLLSRELTPDAEELEAATLVSDSPGDPSAVPHRQLDRPLVLWSNDPRRGRIVVARCRRAAAAGVRLRMPIAGASELSSTLTSADDIRPPLVLPHDSWLDRVALEQLATDLQKQISPLVALESLDPFLWAGQSLHQPQSLLCDITGIAHLFDGEPGLIQAAQQRLSDWGCIGRLAIADNAAAAWALAHHATQARHHSGCESTEACIAPPGSPLPSLAPLPVQSLRLAPETVQTLRRLGIDQISQLLTLPRSGLASRLGERLVNRLSEALGEIEPPLPVHRAAAEETQSWELEYPTADQMILADRIERVMEKIKAGLTARQRGALRLSCCLSLTDLPPQFFEIGLFTPTSDVAHLTQLLVSAIEARPLPATVTRLTVDVTLSGSLQTSQASLFSTASFQEAGAMVDNDDWTRDPAAARLVDVLSGRLGRNAVLGVSLNKNPMPEQAVTFFPLTGNLKPTKKSNQRRRKTSPGSPNEQSSEAPSFLPRKEDPLRRPLALLPHPLPLTAVFSDLVTRDTKGLSEKGSDPLRRGQKPNEIDSPPKGQTPFRTGSMPAETFSQPDRLPPAFRRGGKMHRVRRHWGPERIETNWWQGDSVRRDYYRIETDRGDGWWIFRRLGSGTEEWFLHGYFS